MSVLSIQALDSGINQTVFTSNTGFIGQPSTPLFINTNDTVSTVTVTGYLNSERLIYRSLLQNKAMALVYTTDSGADWYKIEISGENISLIPNEGSVETPVVDGNFAIFSGESGTLKDAGYFPSDSTKTNVVMLGTNCNRYQIAYFVDGNGTIRSGTTTNQTINHNASLALGNVNGDVGNITLYPLGAGKGNLIIACGGSNSFNAQIDILTANDFGQDTTITIPDTGASTAKFILSNSPIAQHIETSNFQVDKGSVISGSDGNAGDHVCYPSTSSKGTFIVAASNNSGAFNTTLTNNSLGQSTIFKLPDPGLANAGILVSSITDPDNNANLIRFDIVVNAASLAAAASVTLFSSSGSKQYKIVNLWINAGGTDFSGGGGDRLLSITDNTTTYSIIPAANLQSLANTAWGATGLPFPAGGVALTTSTAAGASIVAKYSGGTADYAAGSMVISALLQRVV